MSLDKRQNHFIEELYIEMHDKLTVYAQSALDDPSQAEEAVQDTFRIACAKPDDLLSSNNPLSSWKVAVGHPIDLSRRNRFFGVLLCIHNARNKS